MKSLRFVYLLQGGDGDPHTDPFGELVDESNVFVKIETIFADVELAIPEETIDDIKSEWVSKGLKWTRESI